MHICICMCFPSNQRTLKMVFVIVMLIRLTFFSQIFISLAGRLTAHDVAAFAKDSVTAPLRALGPKDFPDRVVDSKDPWFVDFFAPVRMIEF